jgi:hypothetical protein
MNEDRAAGIALVAPAALSMVAMSHHPTSVHAATLGGIVHGAMIVAIATMAAGFTQFARRRGIERFAVLAGLAAYWISLFGHIGAATINGFVVPALAANGAAPGPDIMAFAWDANQALARLGVYFTGVAFLLWSADLLRGGGRIERLLGGVGVIAGVLPIVLLGTGAIRMNIAGAFLVYAMQSGWAALVGLYLMRRRTEA